MSSDPLIGWRIDEIAPGQTITLTYWSTVDPEVSTDEVITTPAEIPEYFAAAPGDRPEDAPSLPSPEPDVTTLTTALPVLSLDHDVNCDSAAQPGDGVDECRVVPGQSVEYVIYVTNTGTAPAYDVLVSDLLPVGLLDQITADPGNPGTLVTAGTATDPSLGWSIPGIAVGETVELRFTAVVSSNTSTDDVIPSTASVDEYWPAPAADRTPDMPTGVLPADDTTTLTVDRPVLALDLDVSCDANAEPGDGVDHCQVVGGQYVTMTFTVTNTSDVTAYDTIASVLVDPRLTGVVPSIGNPGTMIDSWSVDDPDQSWSIPSLAPGESITFVYSGYVVGSVTEADLLTDHATVDEFFAVPSDIRPDGFASEPLPTPDDVTLQPVLPVLTLDQDVSCDAAAEPGDGVDRCAVVAGEEVVYIIRITNDGSSPAYDVRVDSLVPPELENVVMSSANPGSVIDGWTASDPDLAWTIPVIGVGETIEIRYTASVLETVTGQVTIVTPAEITEAFVAPADELTEESPDVSLPAPDVAELVTVSPELGVEIDIVCPVADSPCPWVPGSTVEFTVSIPNTGDYTAYGALIDILIPAELRNVVPTGSTGGSLVDGWSTNDPTIRWQIDQIPVGDTIVLTFTAVVSETAVIGVPFDVVAHVDEYWSVPADELGPDSVPGPQPADAVAPMVPVMPTLTLDHDISCDANAEPGDGVDHCVVAPGAPVVGIVTIGNDGNWPAWETTVSIAIPDGIIDVEVTEIGGGSVIQSWSIVNGEIIVVLNGPLAPGETWTIEWHGQVDPTVETDVVLESPATIISAFPEAPDRREPTQIAVVLPPTDIVSVTATLPTTVVDKVVSCADADPAEACSLVVGDQAQYAVTITNEGPTSLFDVVVSDTADQSVVIDEASLTVMVDGLERSFEIVDHHTATDPDVRVRVDGELKANSAIRLTYRSTVNAVGRSLVNTAVVESAYTVSSGEREEGESPIDGAVLSTTGARPSDDAAVDVKADETAPIVPTSPTVPTLPAPKPGAPSSAQNDAPSSLALTGAALAGLVGLGLVVSGLGGTATAGAAAIKRRRRTR